MRVSLPIWGAVVALAACSSAHDPSGRSLSDRRNDVNLGRGDGVVLVPAPTPAAPAPAPAAPGAPAAAAPSAPPPAAAAPSGRPLNQSTRLTDPSLGIGLPSAVPASAARP